MDFLTLSPLYDHSQGPETQKALTPIRQQLTEPCFRQRIDCAIKILQDELSKFTQLVVKTSGPLRIATYFIYKDIFLPAKEITAGFIAFMQTIWDRHFTVIRIKQQEIKPLCSSVSNSWQDIV